MASVATVICALSGCFCPSSTYRTEHHDRASFPAEGWRHIAYRSGPPQNKRPDKQSDIEMKTTQQVQPCRARGAGSHTFPFFKAKENVAQCAHYFLCKGESRRTRWRAGVGIKPGKVMPAFPLRAGNRGSLASKHQAEQQHQRENQARNMS